MTIARLIEGRSSEVVSCDAALSVREAVAILAERRIGALPVFDGGKIAGIFSSTIRVTLPAASRRIRP